jgi:hypothetical protein
MKRREFITLVGGAAVARPATARAQQGNGMRRVGVFWPLTADDAEVQARNAAFLQRLSELGWTVGRNLRIDHRFGAGDPELLSQIRGRTGRARAGCHPRDWPLHRDGAAASDSRHADRIRGCH